MSARLVPAHHENRRDVEAARGHQMRGRRLVARRQTDHAVELRALDRDLHVVDDQIPPRAASRARNYFGVPSSLKANLSHNMATVTEREPPALLSKTWYWYYVLGL